MPTVVWWWQRKVVVVAPGVWLATWEYPKGHGYCSSIIVFMATIPSRQISIQWCLWSLPWSRAQLSCFLYFPFQRCWATLHCQTHDRVHWAWHRNDLQGSLPRGACFFCWAKVQVLECHFELISTGCQQPQDRPRFWAPWCGKLEFGPGHMGGTIIDENHNCEQVLSNHMP